MADSYYQFGKWITNPLPGEEVVISGVSGRLPESNNIHEFRDNLFNKKDMVTDDDRRWKLDHPEIPQRNGKIYNIDKFDTGYFGVHYRQADVMDPMMKKFLETAIEAILDAGINPSELEGSKTGVFVGACYADMEIETLRNITEPQKLGVTGYLRSLIANRLSYFLKLKGPSCILDTACSSSLNALELAFKTLRSGQCDTVIVGGVNLLIHPGITRQFFRLGVLSADGTCKVFDQRADGYVRGETIACIVLQKARVARRIYGEIVYSKVNCDGFKSSGITFPSTKMQNQLMTEVLNESGIDPSELSFVEAHGTGTQVGDPQEVEAIDCAFSKKRNKPLLIGSVKCSVGHTEPSSGLCSLIKVIIAMETGHIPPNIHLTNIKKGMKGLEEGRLKVVTESTELDRDDAIIAINNFGFGGNNCHVLVRRFKKIKTEKMSEENNVPRLICVSGRTLESISVLLNDIHQRPVDLEYFGLLHQIFKENVAGHVYRGFTIIAKGDSIKTGLTHFRHAQTPLYVFFGKFEHGCNILCHYLMNFECFRTTIKKIGKYLSSEDINIENILENRSEVGRNVLGAFIVQIGMVEILKLLNLHPVAVYGESLGKIISAYYYEMITLEEAVETICTVHKSCKVVSFDESFSELEIINSKKKIRHIIDSGKDLRGDFLTYDSLIKFSKNSTILNVSDLSFTDRNELLLVENNTIKFLEILGRLYEDGHNLHLHKLYQEVKYPVSRGTPMISPLIKWNYSKNWYTFKFGNVGVSDVTQQEHNLSCALYEEDKYLTGHVIDGRNLIPAAKYLYLVWSTFIQSRKLISTDLPVVFENCKFVRAVTLPKTGSAVRLLISIQQGSGIFEVVEKDSLVVSGRIYTPVHIEEHLTKLPPISLNLEDRSDILEQDEIYRELYLRGYNYSGLFKGLAKCNAEGSVGLVRWEQNYTTFIDKMLQLKIIQMDTRLLYVPVGFRKLTIDPLNHLRFIEKQEDSLCPVFAYKDCNVIRSGAIEICGLKARSISKRKPTLHPVLEKYVFVPNTAKLVLSESVRVNTQIILENSLETNFKAVEIIDDCTKPDSEILMPLFSKVLDDIPLVVLNLTVSTKSVLDDIPGITIENFILTPTSGLLLIVGSNLFKRPTLMKQILEALSKNGFVLTREELDSVPESDKNIEILTEHVTDKEKLILFCQRERASNEERFVQMDATRFDWLPDLQKLLHEKSNVVVFSQHEDNSQGTVGLVNCIRREPGGKNIRCFCMMDDGPKFDPQISFYADQNRKHLAINIYKDNRWGTYRHMLLDNLQEVEGEHFYVNNTVKGDLSSLNWFEGTLNRCTKMNKNRALVYPYYTAINFKDIMLASGRVTVDAITRDRIVQECLQGFEFCGKDLSGRRVTGMINNGALSTIVAADTTFLWEIPDKWTLEEGASVAAVYVTVIYAIVWIAKLKRGMSVLIHSATGGIGLAAINVCLYYGCKIFVTVGRQEKKDYLRQHFPQILESQIGNSRDTSFQQMIEVETQGRGVDVVLNSLSEDKLRASVRCLASGGTFLEIGKFDIENDASLNLLLMERNVSYHGVMLDRIVVESEEMKAWIHEKIYEGFRLGYVKPLPQTIFRRNEVEKAYRYMMTGKHIGKIMLQIREKDDQNSIAPPKTLFQGIPRFNSNPNKTYVIVGGLGGFGLELADWLFLRGAKNLVLVSRVGIQTGFQKQRIRNWRAYGITVQISTKDVTTKQGCLELIEEASKVGTIDGIFNLAVVLKDSLFGSQSQDTFRISLEPKAQATKNLDEVTREHCPGMRYFVVFSSVSCGRGNAGQSNYGMANSIMERICEKRKRDGFPALAIQWGAIGDVGLVAKMQKENKELVIGGTLQQKVSSCLEVLDKFLKQDNPIVASMVVAEKNYKSYDSGSAVDAVAYILGIKDIKTIGQHMTFAELGMDSMMGTEMIQILENDFEIYLTAKDVRSLTFAKLIEIEAEKKKNENADTKMKKKGDMLLQYMPGRQVNNSKLEKMASLVENDKGACTVFILPGIEGVHQPLVPLAKGLKAHVFCVQYSYDNPEDSVEETAKNVLPYIKMTLSKNSSFYVIGYSYGTAVGVELVCLLEKEGYLGHFIAIDGSPEYLRMAMKQQFATETDAEFETLLLIKVLAIMLPIDILSQIKDKLQTCKNFEERINLAASLIPMDILEKQKLDKQVAIVFEKRFKSISNYRFDHNKIKSFVHLIKAKFSIVADIESDYKLSTMCERTVKVNVLDGDHVTILKRLELVEYINQLLHST